MRAGFDFAKSKQRRVCLKRGEGSMGAGLADEGLGWCLVGAKLKTRRMILETGKA